MPYCAHCKNLGLKFDDHNLKIFRDNWREYFQEYDERHCEIFQNLNTSRKAEGSDIYLPLFFSKTL